MNLDDIKKLLEAFSESGVSDFEYSAGDERIRLRRELERPSKNESPQPPYIVVTGPSGGGWQPALSSSSPNHESAATPQPPPAAESVAPSGGPSGAADEEATDGLTMVASPIVGTFYESPSPDAPAFVQLGDRVKRGQVLCIIEAMKLMNEIEAEHDGVVVKRFATNAQPVEYGEALFALKID